MKLAVFIILHLPARLLLRTVLKTPSKGPDVYTGDIGGDFLIMAGMSDDLSNMFSVPLTSVAGAYF